MQDITSTTAHSTSMANFEKRLERPFESMRSVVNILRSITSVGNKMSSLRRPSNPINDIRHTKWATCISCNVYHAMQIYLRRYVGHWCPASGPHTCPNLPPPSPSVVFCSLYLHNGPADQEISEALLWSPALVMNLGQTAMVTDVHALTSRLSGSTRY